MNKEYFQANVRCPACLNGITHEVYDKFQCWCGQSVYHSHLNGVAIQFYQLFLGDEKYIYVFFYRKEDVEFTEAEYGRWNPELLLNEHVVKFVDEDKFEFDITFNYLPDWLLESKEYILNKAEELSVFS